MGGADWYVLHTRTTREMEVSRRVKQAGITALVPRRQMVERRRGLRRIVVRNLFPGYVFVYTALDAKAYCQLAGIPYVIRILGHGAPQPVTPEEMNRVLRLAREDDLVGVSQILYENGRVRVLSGPLAGLEGQIVKLDRRKGRAKVNIPLFNQPRFVDLSVHVLEKSE